MSADGDQSQQDIVATRRPGLSILNFLRSTTPRSTGTLRGTQFYEFACMMRPHDHRHYLDCRPCQRRLLPRSYPL